MSFKHTIIIMTSNLGSAEIYKATAGKQQKQQQKNKGAAEGEGGIAADPQIRELVMDQVSSWWCVCVHRLCISMCVTVFTLPMPPRPAPPSLSRSGATSLQSPFPYRAFSRL